MGYRRTFLPVLFCIWLGISWGQPPPATWRGVVRNTDGEPLAEATVELQDVQGARRLTSKTDADGAFTFLNLVPGTYSVGVGWQGLTRTCDRPLVISAGQRLEAWLEFGAAAPQLILHFTPQAEETRASGGQRLSSQQVSELPLNKRDFSQLLLLAAGTMTDTNGAANFTQQFAVNGQRGTTAVFALDGIDSTDPELGGATFSNFNVDAIQEISAGSGVMPAEIGHGAASFTNVITKSGSSQIHGSAFEFVRNAAFDARNFFDRRTLALPGRIPPFIRDEFGFTTGGPVVIPGVYNGRDRTFFFGQYQGFRQVLGTTQVFPVPTAEERQGIDRTAFPGDTLMVPVSRSVAPILARYPLPNDPEGPYGARTDSTASKVSTVSDQFSIRIDHRISNKAQLFARFNLDNVTGPTTNPDQTAIDPSFAITFFDHERNFGLRYSRTLSPNLTSDAAFGLERSTPFFPTLNSTQPGMLFGDLSYEPFNSASGKSSGAIGNLFQFQENLSYVHRTHTFKLGMEVRLNRDITIFGPDPNGKYTFGGGPAYSPVDISSTSGLHDVPAGGLLPDALSGLLTATPFSYEITAAPPIFPQGSHQGESAVHHEAYSLYVQDSWKITPRFLMNYGFRYEVNTPFREAHHLSSSGIFVGADGRPAPVWQPGVQEKWLVNLQPAYNMDWAGWGPRLSLEWRVSEKTLLHAGASVMTLLPLSWECNSTVDSAPFLFDFLNTAMPQSPVPFEDSVQTLNLPPVYTPQGQPIYPTGRSTDAAPNTQMDLLRFQQDLALVSPFHQIQPITPTSMAKNFVNGYVPTYTAGFDHDFGEVRLSASYVATVGVRLADNIFPNAYGGADQADAPFTEFGPSGQILGGYGPEFLLVSSSHSTYHALQANVAKTSRRAGLGVQASYTFSKSLDDTSSPLAGLAPPSSGTLLGSWPQDPQNPEADKGPSTFDQRHTFTMTLIYDLPLSHFVLFRRAGRGLTTGWQLLNISTLSTGPPFSVFSGIQQTGFGSGGGDRPDQVGVPVFSTVRKVREDYFGLGANNASYFSIPIHVAGGTGPNQGTFGTLGRDTFHGPAYHNFDFALIKDTPLGHRGQTDAPTAQFRAEFFNAFNLVNFGLPANILHGSGFGLISNTTGTSRQIQLSLKLLF